MSTTDENVELSKETYPQKHRNYYPRGL